MYISVAAKSAMSLLRMLTENNLQSVFSETLKVTSAELERGFSIFKYSKMGQKRLSALAMLSIKQEFIRTPDFNDMVINIFASQNGHQCKLLFK